VEPYKQEHTHGARIIAPLIQTTSIPMSVAKVFQGLLLNIQIAKEPSRMANAVDVFHIITFYLIQVAKKTSCAAATAIANCLTYSTGGSSSVCAVCITGATLSTNHKTCTMDTSLSNYTFKKCTTA
jgi:hypothetical protein